MKFLFLHEHFPIKDLLQVNEQSKSSFIARKLVWVRRTSWGVQAWRQNCLKSKACKSDINSELILKICSNQKFEQGSKWGLYLTSNGCFKVLLFLIRRSKRYKFQSSFLPSKVFQLFFWNFDFICVWHLLKLFFVHQRSQKLSLFLSGKNN